MASAPAVQSLSDLVAEQNTALAPQQSQIDNEIVANDQSGQAQTAGLDAAQTAAFGKITQASNDRGAYFSGFTPSQEAGYTGSTYLPALAKLQATIDQTKNTLLGQKATLSAQANTNALGTQKTQQSALDSFNAQQQQEDAAAAAATQDQQFTAQQNALNRSATASQTAAATAAATAKADQQALQTSAGQVAAELNKVTGSDGYVSPNSYAAAKKAFVSQGYTGAQFDQLLAGYRNPTNKYYQLG